MKIFWVFIFLIQLVHADTGIILSPVDHIYIPEGFDSNDSIEVILSGSFPDTCHSRNKVEIKVRPGVIDLTVTAIRQGIMLRDRSFCPNVMVPFKEVVSLGTLKAGAYSINVNLKGPLGQKGMLKVKEASSSATDDYLYGAVEWIEQVSTNKYLLHGHRYSPCFVLGEIKVQSNGKDTLSILPILKQTSNFCPMKGVPVTYPVTLDFTGLKIKRPLLHVRTMDGRSVNTIINLED